MTNESLSYILASSGSATSAASAGSQTSQSDADKIEIEKGYLISQQEQEIAYRRRRGGEKKGKEERENQNQPTRIRWFWNSGVDTATNVTVWIQFSDAECAQIEQAFTRGREQVQLGDDISVNLKHRIRHKTSNRKQQWEAKRVEEGTPHDTKSATEEEALNKAKKANGIREDQGCDYVEREPDRQNPDLQCLVLVYIVNGKEVKIRRDNAVTYSNGHKQRGHFNAGPGMEQHHYF